MAGSRKTYHLTYNTARRVWELRLRGAKTVSAKFARKTDAIKRGRELAKKPRLGQLVIHKQNGKIQIEYTYGEDPRRSKG